MGIKSVFAKSIYDRRNELGLSQAQVAEMVNISVRGYQKIEGSRVIPNLKTASKIAYELQVSLDPLIQQVYGGRQRELEQSV